MQKQTEKVRFWLCMIVIKLQFLEWDNNVEILHFLVTISKFLSSSVSEMIKAERSKDFKLK